MSPLFRVFIILSFSLIGSIALLASERNRIDERYLRILSVGFIFIDLHFSLGPIDISPFLVISLFYIIRQRKLLGWFISRPPVYILIGIVLITTIFSQYKAISIFTSIHRLFMMVPIAAAYSVFLRCDVYRTITKLIIPPVIYTIIFSIIQLLIDPSFSLYYSIWDKDETRLSLIYMDPQIAGCAIATLLTLIFNVYLSSKKPIYLILFFILLYIGCFTGSKTFILGSAIAVTISLIRTRFSIKLFTLAIILVAIITATHDIWSTLPAFERMAEIQESFEVRTTVFWIKAIDIFLDNPIFGIGPGSFSSYIEEYNIPMIHHLSSGEFVYAEQPESGYLLWLDEYGFFSITLIALLIYIITRKGDKFVNSCALIPWIICFTSLYNIGNIHIIVILSIIVGGIFASDKKIKALQ